MANQRQSFVFRFPWMGHQTRTPQTKRTRPTRETRSPAQMTAALAAFTAAGIDPTQPPPSQPSKTEPQNQPASPAPTESSGTSQPPSPSRAPTESSGTSQPPSPSRAPKESRATTSQPSSPSRLPSSPSRASSKSRASSDSPSKSPPISNPQPASQTASSLSASETTSSQAAPPEIESPAKKDVLQSASLSSQPQSSESQRDEKVAESQREEKVAESQPPLLEPEKKMEIASEKTHVSPNRSPMKTNPQASDSAATQPKLEITPETEKTSKSPLKTTPQDEREADISSKKVAEAIGRDQKTVEEFAKEEKTKSPAYEEPVQKTITKHIPTVTGRRKHTRDPAIVAYRQEKLPRKQETSSVEEKKLATTSFIGKQIKTVTSSGDTSNTSFQNPVSSTADEQAASRQKEIKEDISKLVHKLTTGHQMVEGPVTVITLTGENRGASMNVSSEPAEEEESVHIHRGYKLNPDDSAETATDGDVNDSQGTRLTDHLSREAPPINAYANSNAQSINNSLVFNASVTERNPGIHFQFSQDGAEPTRKNGTSESHHARRAQVTITPSEKLTHERTVKRRCLKGLFLESSDDSEPDNPEKPRRHGCRNGCSENKKDRELGA